MIIDFSHETEKTNELITHLPRETVIGEVSGKDSAAAMIKALERDDINIILPVASFAGVESGSLDGLKNVYTQLTKRVKELYGDEKTILPLVFYSNPSLWSVINGKIIAEIVSRYGFYTPCIGCHAYFHILRTPLALKLGRKIITGERESHGEVEKLCQLPFVIDAYTEIVKSVGVELIHPVRTIKKEDDILHIIGHDWVKSKSRIVCPFGGNMKDVDRSHEIYNKDTVERYLEEYLKPTCIELANAMSYNPELQKPDMARIARDVLKRINRWR